MIQLELELEWLADDWKPKHIEHFNNKNNDAFDDYQAMQYGYKSYADMIAQSNKKHQENKLHYGDRYVKGWM